MIDVGRVVHYVEPDGTCSVAVVTHSYSDEQVDLIAFPRLSDQVHVHGLVWRSTTIAPGMWHWFGNQVGAIHSAG